MYVYVTLTATVHAPWLNDIWNCSCQLLDVSVVMKLIANVECYRSHAIPCFADVYMLNHYPNNCNLAIIYSRYVHYNMLAPLVAFDCSNTSRLLHAMIGVFWGGVLKVWVALLSNSPTIFH